MDVDIVFAHLKSLVVPIVLFSVLLGFVMIQGRRALTSLILGLYLALLLSLVFPYYQVIFGIASGEVLTETVLRIIIFAIFTAAGTIIFDRLLFYRVDEAMFEGFWKKAVLALLGTVLILAFSYHVLPLPQLVSESTIIHTMFSPREFFFWWLIFPLLVLFLL